MARDQVARRDAGLRRVSRVTRTVVVGGLVATGAFSALAARAHPGAGTTQATTPTSDPSSAATSATVPAQTSGSTSGPSSSAQSSSTADDQLQAPTTTVRPSSRSGRVTSGGS